MSTAPSQMEMQSAFYLTSVGVTMQQVVTTFLEPLELKKLISDTIKENLSGFTNPTIEITHNDLIKIDEVCRILNVSKVTVFAWKKRGLLPFYRISNKIYFKKDEIIQALKKSQNR